MAASFLPNLFSFFTTSNQPPPPPPSVPVPPPSQVSFSSTNRGISSDELRSNPSPLSSSSDVTSVICPSLAYANTLFFRSAYNVQVLVDDNEPEEKLLGRFRREVMKAGVVQECKRLRFFENKMRRSAKHSRLRSAIVSDCLKQYIPEVKKQDVDARGDEESSAACNTQKRILKEKVLKMKEEDVIRRRPQWINGTQDREEASKTKKSYDNEDNWNIPEGALA